MGAAIAHNRKWRGYVTFSKNCLKWFQWNSQDYQIKVLNRFDDFQFIFGIHDIHCASDEDIIW